MLEGMVSTERAQRKGDRMSKKLIVIACGLLLLAACAVITKELTNHKPNLCDYKVLIIFRGQFRTEGDFYRSVTAQIEWLWEHDYEVLSLEYKYGFDMTRSLILRFAVLKYEEIKNEKK